MKKLTHSFTAKVVAIIIFIILSIFTIINIMGIGYGENMRMYYGTDSFYRTYIMENTVYISSERVIRDYIDVDEDYFEDIYSSDRSNLRFSISKNDTPDIIEYTNHNDDEKMEYAGSFLVDDYIITINLANPITAHDEFYQDYKLFNFIYPIRYVLFVFLALSIIFIIIDIIFLFSSAGRKEDTDEVYLNYFDKIPFDIVVLAEAFAVYLMFILEDYFYIYTSIGIVIVISILSLFAAILLITALSFAVRIKKGVFINQLLLVKIFKLIIKYVKLASSLVVNFFRMLPYIWQGALITLFIISLNISLIVAVTVFWTYDWLFLLLWLIFNIIVFIGICFGLSQMNKLKKSGKRMSDGDIETKLNTEKMYFHFKEHGNNLNEISKGMNIAIEEHMKSEHLKTELITNVSHDIKTPLTSIINYVDLMKQEDINNENVEKYLNVVDKQSIRLKKLLEDLVEVSKASTGNVTIENTPSELNVLLGQVAGEYKEKLENEGLNLILDAPEEPVVILGDGRHLWRIFDNLLNNICKYTQEKTRVYLTLEKQDNKAIITFRNISKYPLNITSDELVERFIRGDKSRHTEGSGLGLSIAKSLTQLQKGNMEIVIDGDLFKVVLTFDLYKSKDNDKS